CSQCWFAVPDRRNQSRSKNAMIAGRGHFDCRSLQLATQLDTVPEPARIAFVELVAITLGIPERGQPKGDQAFAQWQAQRAHPDADSTAPATSETQTSTPAPTNANDLPRHVDDSSREIRDLVDRMGVTVTIEALYREGKTAEQVSQALTKELDFVPERMRVSLVELVATTLGIPKRGEPKGDQAFAQWQAQRAQPAADSAATASAETPTPVPTPSDAAPEPVSSDAAKPQANDPDLQSPSELVRLEAQWRRDFPMSEADVSASDTVMGLRGEDHAVWIIATDDKTPEAAAMLTAYMENDSYREAFKSGLETAYRQVENWPQAVQDLDQITEMAVKIVQQVEARLYSAPQAASGQATPSRNKVIEGELIEHGPAPYQHKDDKQMSYFVTLKPEGGKPRTVWGVGLEDAMKDSNLKQGDQVRLEDLGTRPVVVQVIEEDGTVTDKTVNRREWSAQPVAPEREVAQTTPKGQAAAAGTPELSSPDEDDGMSMD
ncbi:hypothetical protein, partial [Pseudomonas syringae group genomosp. 3]